MDDLVIIIMTLVFTLLAVINQSKKKKNPGENKIPDFWETILTGEKAPPASYPQEIQTEKRGKVIPVPAKDFTGSWHESPAPKPEEGSVGRIVRKSETTDTTSLDDIPGEKSLLTDFSLKKAVIYSEILHPKYL